MRWKLQNGRVLIRMSTEQKDVREPQIKAKRKEEHDYLAKIVIIGDSSVGKTNLLLRFVTGAYLNCHTPTIGVDFKAKIIEINSGAKLERKRVKLQLWDTAGQQRFRTITQTYYHGASGIVIVYAIDNKKSFDNVKDWLHQIAQHNGDDLPKILVGNKSDLIGARQVTTEQGRLLADANGCSFMEVSAKENINVEEAFVRLAMTINYNLKQDGLKTMFSSDVRSSKNIILNSKIEENKGCCMRVRGYFK